MHFRHRTKHISISDFAFNIQTYFGTVQQGHCTTLRIGQRLLKGWQAREAHFKARKRKTSQSIVTELEYSRLSLSEAKMLILSTIVQNSEI